MKKITSINHCVVFYLVFLGISRLRLFPKNMNASAVPLSAGSPLSRGKLFTSLGLLPAPKRGVVLKRHIKH